MLWGREQDLFRTRPSGIWTELARGGGIIPTPSFFLQRAWDFHPLLGKGDGSGSPEAGWTRRQLQNGAALTHLFALLLNPWRWVFPKILFPISRLGGTLQPPSPVLCPTRQAAVSLAPHRPCHSLPVLGPSADILREASQLWEERGCEGRGLLAPQIVSLHTQIISCDVCWQFFFFFFFLAQQSIRLQRFLLSGEK